jgi:glycosyltransferase involved in cell wall biosynthesis
MKIAIWLEQNQNGGVDTHLRSLLQGWPRRADVFTLFTNTSNYESAIKLFDSNFQNHVELVEIKRKSQNTVLGQIRETFLLPLYLLSASVGARKKLVAHGPFDAIIINNGSYPGSWATLGALRAACREKIKSRLLLIHHQASFHRPFLSSIESIIDRRVFTWCTSVVAVSFATRKSLIDRRKIDLTKTPIRVIHNGLPEIQDVTKGRLRSIVGATDTSYLVGIIGRVEIYKGIEELLRAVHLANSALQTDFRLVVIGECDPRYLKKLNELLNRLELTSYVCIVGFIDISTYELIIDLDLLVSVTQEFEGFGFTILEAMKVGTPVLATRVGGVTEFFDESCGTLVRPGSISEIAEALIEIYGNQKSARQRAEFAIKKSDRFSSHAMALAFYQELVL